jgi:hypothetical protein
MLRCLAPVLFSKTHTAHLNVCMCFSKQRIADGMICSLLSASSVSYSKNRVGETVCVFSPAKMEVDYEIWTALSPVFDYKSLHAQADVSSLLKSRQTQPHRAHSLLAASSVAVKTPLGLGDVSPLRQSLAG